MQDYEKSPGSQWSRRRAEAGANPISQAALTLSNGLTYVELFNSRGLDANKFLRNFSWFFSNGMDPEYAVIGRVCRRIWAIAMRDMYGVDERGQKLKYHIQSSGVNAPSSRRVWENAQYSRTRPKVQGPTHEEKI